MSSEADVRHHIKGYLLVGVALLILTGVTVLASYVKMSVPATITLAIFIATVKAGFVACYFMHLINEKKLIYWSLLMTFFFFVTLLLLPVLTQMDEYGQGFIR